MEFDYFWKKQRELEPGEPKYISLCKILQGSGEDYGVIEGIFMTYMTLEDYDLPEKKEMLDYLFDVAKDK
jgi:hypothetical protein